MTRIGIFAACVLLSLGGCGLLPQRSGGDILVIGDSVLAWNGFAGANVGNAIEAQLGRDVVSRAALGAQLDASNARSLLGLDIPGQLSSGRWNWVVMNGGANDLGESCDCGKCDAVMDGLMSADAQRGEIPTLITRARAQGAQVVWMGYYQAPKSTSFKGCRPLLVELERRIATYAQRQPGVVFIDAEDAFDPTDDTLFAPDNTHPSPKGSALLGRFIARTITAESTPDRD